jgi:GntR family transcriptional repressor for pyruvate dehydrogenase complex
MIESRSGGTFVCKRSEFLSRPLLWAIAGSAQTDTYQLLEARIAIELELVDLAAQRATSQDLDAISTQLHVMETALQGAPFLEADLAFHIAVGQAAHNDILLNALLLIRNLIHQWIERTLKLEGIASQALEQHRAIHRAIAAKDRDSARTAMRNHLDVTASLLMQAQRASLAFQSPANTGISDSPSSRLIDHGEGHA